MERTLLSLGRKGGGGAGTGRGRDRWESPPPPRAQPVDNVSRGMVGNHLPGGQDLWAQRELMPSHPTVFEGESPMKVPEGLSGPSGSFTDGETEAQGLAWGLSAEVLPRQPCS